MPAISIRTLPCIILLVATFLVCRGQNQHRVDSLKQALITTSDESEKLSLLTRLFWEYRGADNEVAVGYSEQVMQMAKETGSDLELAKAYQLDGVANETLGKLDEAETSFATALEMALPLEDTTLIAATLNSLGILNHKKSNYERALSYFMQRVPYLREDEIGALATNYNNIGMINEAIDDNQKALEYFERAIELHRQIGNKAMEGGTLSNMGVIYFKLKEYDAALKCYTESAAIMEALGNKGVLSILYENRGNVYKELDRYEAAIDNYTRALELSKELHDDYGVASVHLNMGEVYLKATDYASARTHFEKSRSASQTVGAQSLVMNADRLLARLFAEQNDYRNAYESLNAYQVLRDTLFNESKNKQIQELQIRYETEKKNQEIALLNSEANVQALALQKERITRNLLLAGAVLVMVIAALIIQQQRQKSKAALVLAARNEEISRQQLVQIEKDRKLEIMDAIITAEEKERTRIARDLHDGLSGLMASIKMQFDRVSHEKDALKSARVYSEAIDALDNANQEVRRIAHNMMPQTLMKFGLVEALAEYITTIQHTHPLQITFDHSDIHTLEKNQQLTIYRIIQELINNVVRHAHAQHLLVQLGATGNVLLVTVEDDGAGFSPGQSPSGNGIGLSNIESRVTYLGGEVTIESGEGKGTSVYIQIPLNRNHA